MNIHIKKLIYHHCTYIIWTWTTTGHIFFEMNFHRTYTIGHRPLQNIPYYVEHEPWTATGYGLLDSSHYWTSLDIHNDNVSTHHLIKAIMLSILFIYFNHYHNSKTLDFIYFVSLKIHRKLLVYAVQCRVLSWIP